MQRSSRNHIRNEPEMADRGASPRRLRVMIVEQEPLLQWSLGTYLSRWFDVQVAESATAAQDMLDERPVDALVVSDALPDHAADKVETVARLRNCAITIVRTVSHIGADSSMPRGTHCIERPFELASVAALLGVTGVQGTDIAGKG